MWHCGWCCNEKKQTARQSQTLPSEQRMVAMLSIEPINLRSLRNEELLGFCQEVAQKLIKVREVASSSASKVFNELVQAYSDNLDTTRNIKYERIEAADEEVDAAVMGIRAHVQALLCHPNETVQIAAEIIWSAIEPYGNPTKLTFNEEYAIVGRMIDTLESIDPERCEDALMTEWISTLHERYDAFMMLRSQFHSERAVFPAGRVKASKQTLIQAWKELIASINAMAIIQPSVELETLIAEINGMIQLKKTAIKGRGKVNA